MSVEIMDIKNEIMVAVENSTGLKEINSSMDVSLKNLGVSSIDFFKIIMALSKKVNIDLMSLDPEVVSTKMTINSMAEYFTSPES